MTALQSRTRAAMLAALLIISAIGAVATPTVASGSTTDGYAQQAPNGSSDDGSSPTGANETTATAEESSQGADNGDRQGDNDDTRANATPIEPNEFVEGDIDDAGGDGRDVDWYRFDVAAGDHLRVVSFEGYGVGSSYILYGPNGEVLGSGDEYGTEDAPVAGTTDAAGGTYYLEVTVDDGLAGESYGFSVETTAPDPFEPNERRDEAVPVEPGEARSGVIAAGDSDWFAVDLAAGETLDATVELTDSRSLGYIGANNVGLALYDPRGTEVGENPRDVATNNAPADQTSRFDGRFKVTQRTVAEEGGTYYVRVTGVGTTGFSTYDLTTSVSETSGGDDGDSDDGNDSNDDSESGDGPVPFENATAVDSLSAIGNGQIGADGNADVYAFEMREGSQVEIMQGIGGGAYPVTLLDENGTVLGRITSQEVYRDEGDLLRANASDTGTYYLKIEGNAGDRYSILGSVTEPDTNEPNDDRATATTIATGDASQGTIVRGDTDFYAVQLNAGETLDVFANASARAALTVYGPSGSAIDSVEVPSRFDGSRGVPTTSVTAEESGTYYLELSIQSNAIGQVGGEYAIELQSAGGAGGGQSDSGESSNGETGDDVSNDEEPSTDESNTGGSDTNGETPTESATPAPTEQTPVETADGTTSAQTAENTPESSSGEGAVTTTAGDASTEANSGRADDVATETDATTAGGSGNDSESAADGTDTIDDSGSTTADASATGDDRATDAGTAGTTSGASTTENASNATSESSGEAGTQAEETDGTAPSGGAEKTAVDGPGFGLLAALLAVLGVGAFALGRD